MSPNEGKRVLGFLPIASISVLITMSSHLWGMLLCPEAVDGDISLEEIKLDLTLTKQGAGSSSRTLPKRLVPESEQLPAPMYVRLEVFTLPGQRIATLASGSWKYVVLWDVSSGQEKVILEGHTFDVNS